MTHRGGQSDFSARESRVPQRASVRRRARRGTLAWQIWEPSRGRAFVVADAKKIART